MNNEKANAALRDMNNVGARILWCRKQLGISFKQVLEDTGLNRSSYFDREHGKRTYYHEEYKILADYFRPLWKTKFIEEFPVYQGHVVDRVNTMWIMFGVMDE